MKVKHIDFALLVLRLGVGLSLAFANGYGKITGGPEKWEKLGSSMADLGITFLPVFWGFMAAFAEFAGAILVAIGFLTRGAAFLVAFTMLVAVYAHYHDKDSFSDMSHALELFAAYLTILIAGAGKYSADNKVKISGLLQ